MWGRSVFYVPKQRLADAPKTPSASFVQFAVLVASLIALATLLPPPATAREGDADPFELHRTALTAEARGDMARAIDGFSRACAMGLAPSCTMAGLGKLDQATDTESFIAAAADLSAGCLAGSDFACAKLGTALGRASAQSDERQGYVAIALMQMGEECRTAPTAGACYDAAVLLRAEERGGADMDAVQAYAARACAREARPGCLPATVLIADKDNAADRAPHDCLAARSDGCIALLEILLQGEALPEMPAARTVLEQACAKQVGIACANLGLYYSQGPTAERDDAKARHYMRAGCDGAVAQACFAFAVMHKKGIGGPADQKRAVQLVAHACDLGWAKACATQATLIQDSGAAATPGQDAEALRERACRLGDKNACGPRDAPRN